MTGDFITRTVGKGVLIAKPTGEWVYVRDSSRLSNPRVMQAIKRRFDRQSWIPKHIVGRIRQFFAGGPSLHIVHPTLRCNYACIYCFARKDGEDLDEDLAKQTVDLIFTTNRPGFTIEFQGGEPLLRFDIVRFVIDYAKEKARETGKNVHFALVSNLSMMDEDIADYLMKNNVALNSSFDGPRELQEKQRIYTKGSSYDILLYWYEYFRDTYDYIIPLMPTITKYSFDYWKEIVDEYYKLGQPSIWIRPMRPSNHRNLAVWPKIGYTAEEFMQFYRKVFWRAFEYGMREHLMEYVLDRLFTYNRTNTDVFTPCGAGRVQIAYMPNGDIYTCQEGTNYPDFKIGKVQEIQSVMDLMNRSILMEMSIASYMPTHTQCLRCPYQLRCFTCPVINKTLTGSMYKINDYMCKMNQMLFDFALENIDRIWSFYGIPRWLYNLHVM